MNKHITIYQDSFPALAIDSRVYLRESLFTDTEDFFKYYKNPQVHRYILTDPPKTFEDAKADMNYSQQLFKHRRGIYWAIANKKDDKMIGSIGLYINSHHRRAEIFYDLNQDFWRRGIMSAAINKVVDFAFNTVGLFRIEAVTMLENKGSMGVLKACGFEYEGRLRHYKFFKSRPHDVEIFSIIHEGSN
jgi:ribosomal-protein-alanine N-acetyltransferase